MSYQTYTTEAIVVGSYQSGLADKTYLLFTKRAGMLYATARSVREERSRQRCALQDFTEVTVTLVKGKTNWRIGSVLAHQNFYLKASSRAARGSVVRLTKTLRRYVQGEIPDLPLYQSFVESLSVLVRDFAPREAVERCAEVRLLSRLGYVAPDPALAQILTDPLHTLIPTEILLYLETLESMYRGAQVSSHLEH